MKLGSFTSESYSDVGKEMNKVVVLLIKVIAFLPFSLPSPSSLLKLPNVSLSPLTVFWMSRNATLPWGALRDIPKTAARETRDLAAVGIFGHVLKDD